MNKLLKCVDYNPNLEHNISVNTSRKKPKNAWYYTPKYQRIST